MTGRTVALIFVVSLASSLTGCSQCGGSGNGGGGGERTPQTRDDGSPETAGDATTASDSTAGSKALLVAQSTFSRNEKGRWVQPNAAKLIILRQQGSSWQHEVIEDDGSTVFHKGMVHAEEGQDPAVLTIGGDQAALKLWQRGSEGWTAKTLWAPTFGGERNRLRDIEITNFNGGAEELVIATHDQGVVAVVSHTDDGWEPNELDRQENTFVHEIEIGDIDGDGTPEIYATPSHPNLGSGGAQPGQVKRYRWTGEGFQGDVVVEWENRHAKEILVADIDGDGTPELYVALEGETEAGGGLGGRLVHPVEIVRLNFGGNTWTSEVVGTIPNERQCRFLVAGDIDGNGSNELIAAAFTTGIWMFTPGDSLPWSSTSLTRATGGFEHATLLADIDGDGAQELYVADDAHGRLVRFRWNEGRLGDAEVILTRTVPQSAITWNLWIAEL